MPRPAKRWLLVNSTLAAFLEFEVLDGVRDVYLVGIYSCIGQGSSEDLAGWTDKGMTLPVFFIAGCSPTKISRAATGPSPKTA